MTFCCENCFHCPQTVDLTNESFELKCDAKYSGKGEAKAKAYKKLRNSFFDGADSGNDASRYSTANTVNTVETNANVHSENVPSPKPRFKWKTDSKYNFNSKSNDKRNDRILNEKFHVSESDANKANKDAVRGVSKRLNALKMKEESEENKEVYKLDYSVYTTKKNISQGLLDIALLTANTMQLKSVLQRGADNGSLGLYFYIVNLSLIGTSIALQIIVGIILLLNSRQNINDVKMNHKAECCNSVILLIAFIITIVNVFIVVFLDS